MRKPKSAKSSASDAPAPAGGRALGRAQQFTFSRGLPAPVVESTPAVKKRAAAKKTATKKVAARNPPKKPVKS